MPTVGEILRSLFLGVRDDFLNRFGDLFAASPPIATGFLLLHQVSTIGASLPRKSKNLNTDRADQTVTEVNQDRETLGFVRMFRGNFADKDGKTKTRLFVDPASLTENNRKLFDALENLNPDENEEFIRNPRNATVVDNQFYNVSLIKQSVDKTFKGDDVLFITLEFDSRVKTQRGAEYKTLSVIVSTNTNGTYNLIDSTNGGRETDCEARLISLSDRSVSDFDKYFFIPYNIEKDRCSVIQNNGIYVISSRDFVTFRNPRLDILTVSNDTVFIRRLKVISSATEYQYSISSARTIIKNVPNISSVQILRQSDSTIIFRLYDLNSDKYYEYNPQRDFGNGLHFVNTTRSILTTTIQPSTTQSFNTTPAIHDNTTGMTSIFTNSSLAPFSSSTLPSRSSTSNTRSSTSNRLTTIYNSTDYDIDGNSTLSSENHDSNSNTAKIVSGIVIPTVVLAVLVGGLVYKRIHRRYENVDDIIQMEDLSDSSTENSIPLSRKELIGSKTYNSEYENIVQNPAFENNSPEVNQHRETISKAKSEIVKLLNSMKNRIERTNRTGRNKFLSESLCGTKQNLGVYHSALKELRKGNTDEIQKNRDLQELLEIVKTCDRELKIVVNYVQNTKDKEYWKI